jgi:hypothetical protein
VCTPAKPLPTPVEPPERNPASEFDEVDMDTPNSIPCHVTPGHITPYPEEFAREKTERPYLVCALIRFFA